MDIKPILEQRETIKEIVNIGAGNAATALSQMLKQRIDVKVPRVNFVSLDKAADIFGGSETLISGVYFQLLGDAQGIILFSFQQETAREFAGLLTGSVSGDKNSVFDELNQSALKETATILCGAYMTALSKLLRLKLLVSVPSLASDMAGAIVDNLLIQIAKEADYAIIIDTEFYFLAGNKKIETYFFFVPELESLEKILKAIESR